ncbi:MAG TPA: hypothetical protein VFM29_06215 [Vicinamibacteria bacterium]|nr:hypothetical protein [Vicinamibacteria bacterium]
MPGLAVLVLAVAAGAAASTDARIASSAFRVRIARPALATVVTAALEGAGRRLERGACAAIVDDFADAAGRPLVRRLEALGQSPRGYLSQIGFYDGHAASGCHRSRVVAITAPGSRTVWVCPGFTLLQKRDPGLAEVLLLHEMLHSLGLEEDPPTAAEITAGVIARCSR